MLTSRPFIILLAVAIFALCAGGGALLLSMSKSGDGDGGGDRAAAATSEIWSVGDKWTVKVEQDAASISPDSKESTALIPYRFKVESAPAKSSGEWLVRVKQDGAEGPFKAGWRLAYVEQDGVMMLARVGAADQKMIEATVASIVLGSNFPYEAKYTAAPKDQTLSSAALAKRSSLPPVPANVDKAMTVPSGDGSMETGAQPPKDAPVLKSGELPPGAPPTMG